MRNKHRAVILFLPLLMLAPETTAAENQPFLLNCRLMDRASLLYKRYCIGELGEQRRCRDRRCVPQIAVTTNFHSQYDPARKGAGSGAINTVTSTAGVTGTDRSVVGGGVTIAGSATSQISGAVSSTSEMGGGVVDGVAGAASETIGALGGL
jgi:hypothetical protein